MKLSKWKRLMAFTLMVGGCYLFPDVKGDDLPGLDDIEKSVQAYAKELEKLSYEERIELNCFNDLPPLHQAVACGDFLEVRRLLSSGDTNVKDVDEFGHTALHYCYRDVRIAELLISNGADIYARDSSGCIPLMAILKGQYRAEKSEKIIRFLLLNDRHNKMVQSVDEDGETPLHKAVIGNEIAVIRLLLRAGADVNARNYYGNTPLHKGAFLCNDAEDFEVLRILLEEGNADTTVRNNEGLTPAGVAIKHGDTKAAELIFNHKQK